MFDANAAFSSNTGSMTRADWEQFLVWDVAQGTVVSPPECTLSDEVQEESVTVVCHYSNFDALVQALDGAPVPITATLSVTPGGITEERSLFGFPTFNIFGVPF